MSQSITVAVDSVTEANRAIAIASRYLAFEDANEQFVEQEIDDIETTLVNGEVQVTLYFDSLHSKVNDYFAALDSVATDEYRYGCCVVGVSL